MLSKGNVIVGGLKIGGNPITLKDNLRYKYEKKCENSITTSIDKNRKQRVSYYQFSYFQRYYNKDPIRRELQILWL